MGSLATADGTNDAVKGGLVDLTIGKIATN
jgi:hypothetical protein